MAGPPSTRSGDMSPEEIVRRIRNGERYAESALYHRYVRGLKVMLRQRTGDEALAEDLAHDTIRIVLERLRGKGIDEPAKLSAFMQRTAVNVHIGELRRTSRRNTFADSDRIALESDDRGGPLTKLLQEESRKAIRAAIDDLTVPRDREIIRRFYLLEQDKTVICASLDLSVRHFDRVISRARKRFMELILKKRRQLPDHEVSVT